MVRKVISAVAISVVLLTSCTQMTDQRSLTVKTQNDSLSYLVGVGLAMSTQERNIEINNDMVIKGFLETMDGKDVTTDSAYMQLMTDYNKKTRELELAELRVQFDANMKAGEEFINSIKMEPNVKSLKNGMCYVVQKEGKGRTAKIDDQVKASYSIYTIDGQQKFATPEPEDFILSTIELEGMKEGMKLMNEGAKYRFYIPAELAYRDRIGIAIPIGSTIILDVELIDIK